jgi:uncharacterized membrane protein YtjA (UPF0391 family)
MAVGGTRNGGCGQFLQACETETLLIAAFLGFGSLADTTVLIGTVCFVLSPIFAIISSLKAVTCCFAILISQR